MLGKEEYLLIIMCNVLDGVKTDKFECNWKIRYLKQKCQKEKFLGTQNFKLISWLHRNFKSFYSPHFLTKINFSFGPNHLLPLRCPTSYATDHVWIPKHLYQNLTTCAGKVELGCDCKLYQATKGTSLLITANLHWNKKQFSFWD